MKAIKIHGQVLDNGGEYQPAGTTLTVRDEGKTGCITAERAADLVKIHSATAVEDEDRPAKGSKGK